jgi:glutamate-1-semialdehyde 2,1-aminomutase
MSAELQDGLAYQACKAGMPLNIHRAGSLLTVFFADVPIKNYENAKVSDTKLFASFFNGLISHGIYWPPSQFEAAFISAAHTKANINKTIDAAGKVLRQI